ncbi:hypothetical protein MMAD_41440 [Mycolicibacterium madagascariense]|uniref:Uncharacterized protein n=1 Tax=Mycolicibacterium madagascariense TaxID=212765 RepID=A0A7I7XKU3_9MYCO|nr:hypothetical protein MMAD_41440 [Mycolicibacterium madagascariense]
MTVPPLWAPQADTVDAAVSPASAAAHSRATRTVASRPGSGAAAGAAPGESVPRANRRASYA